MTRFAHTLVGLLALIVSAVWLLGVAVTPAAADPGSPGTGSPDSSERITVTLTSDREWNEAATWYDSTNRFRYQRDISLGTHDPKTKLWSSSMAFTSRVAHHNSDVGFISTGRYARCVVAVNGKVVRTDEKRGPHATALCRSG